MRKTLLLAASAGIARASQTVFSVHDDLLAFPQYEVIFSDSFISDNDADILLGRSSASSGPLSDTRSIQFHNAQTDANDHAARSTSAAKETYELMMLHDQEFLCAIPMVDVPARNETSETEARAEEQKELARATDRGWELLQDLERNCLYFISGWWSYSFCYNSEVTQFHQLPPQPGRPPYPPQKDPKTTQYILGRVRDNVEVKEDDFGNQVEVHSGTKHPVPPHTEIQVNGDSRYLVQRMKGGTICDLTGKPRHIEIQYHCSPQASDRIGWIREVTTCSYLMVIYTPRLCNDVAFQPPKESKANAIACRMVVPEDEMTYWEEQKAIEAEIMMKQVKAENPVVNIGGTIVGGHKYFGTDGHTLPLPKGFSPNQPAPGPVVDVIARSKSKADKGQVEVLDEAALEKLDLDLDVVEELKEKMQKMAGDKGWRLEVIDTPGDVREIRGIWDEEDDGNEADAAPADNGSESNEEGSEETYKEDL
ncbi:MAG: Protein OS-9 [Claussenomyces sp. TS43310]|nr:MAG: Protein OS-9 [Claussenomyces sp. TS43310]